MKTKMICAFAIACTSMTVVSMEDAQKGDDKKKRQIAQAAQQQWLVESNQQLKAIYRYSSISAAAKFNECRKYNEIIPDDALKELHPKTREEALKHNKQCMLYIDGCSNIINPPKKLIFTENQIRSVSHDVQPSSDPSGRKFYTYYEHHDCQKMQSRTEKKCPCILL